MARSARHVASLDGLRGLGALCVVVHHYAFDLFRDAPGYPAAGAAMTTVARTPGVHVFFAGYPWVNLFFVLSGFALSAMLSGPGNTPRTYLPYAINRTFRIYPAYIVAVLVTFLLQRLVYSGPIADFGDWFNSSWSEPATRSDAIDHAIMIGQFRTDRFVFVIWSLVHEMRISLLFPLLYAAVSRLSVRGHVCAGVGLLALDFAWAALADRGQLASNTYYFTLHYALLFWAGSAIFKYRAELEQWWVSRPTGQLVGLAGAGFLLFSYGTYVEAVLPPEAMRAAVVADWLTGAGAASFILLALYSAPVARVLSSRALTFVGAISYSLYLAHGIVLFAALHALYGVVPLALLLPACAVASFAIAWLSATAIEQPFLRLGKRAAAAVIRAKT